MRLLFLTLMLASAALYLSPRPVPVWFWQAFGSDGTAAGQRSASPLQDGNDPPDAIAGVPAMDPESAEGESRDPAGGYVAEEHAAETRSQAMTSSDSAVPSGELSGWRPPGSAPRLPVRARADDLKDLQSIMVGEPLVSVDDPPAAPLSAGGSVQLNPFVRQ